MACLEGITMSVFPNIRNLLGIAAKIQIYFFSNFFKNVEMATINSDEATQDDIPYVVHPRVGTFIQDERF